MGKFEVGDNVVVVSADNVSNIIAFCKVTKVYTGASEGHCVVEDGNGGIYHTEAGQYRVVALDVCAGLLADKLQSTVLKELNEIAGALRKLATHIKDVKGQ